MSPAASELFKAIFIVSMFACLCGVVRLAFLPQLAPRLKVLLGGFLAFMLLPSGYLYLRLAFPEAAEALLPYQSMAIWMYGPLLLGILHLTTHQPLRRWQVWLYVAPVVCAVALKFAALAQGRALPPWWELLALSQASLFAAAALARTIQRRGQLRLP